MASQTRAARRSSRKISYREDNTTSGSEDDDPQQDEVASERILSSSSLNKRPRISRSSSQRKVKAPRSGRSTAMNNTEHENSHPVVRLKEKIPRWQNLPYHVLATIFQYENQPSCLSWRARLVQTALLCNSFVEPALSALYFELDLTLIAGDVKLYNLLKFQTTDSYLNYRGKVKWLVFAVTPGKSRYPRNRDQIVEFTPQLRGIKIKSYTPNIDSSWYQLMDTLKAHHISLRDWVWFDMSSYKLKIENPTFLNCVYPTTSQQTLERLEIKHRSRFVWGPQEFAKAINGLPRLKHLTFNLANLIDPEPSLSLLSVKLESLKFSRSSAISPAKLALFLAVQGQKLRILDLSGISPQCQSVMVDLARSCPQLQDLRIAFAPLSDTPSPAGPECLRPDEIPTWPSSLWRLEVLQWGGWTLSSADIFFSSLINSAASLPNLRHIHIRASLGESGWKSRVRFREKWTGRFSHVFLRASKPSSPYLRSLSAHQAFSTAQNKQAGKSIVDDSHPAVPGPSSAIPVPSSKIPGSSMAIPSNSDDTGHRRSHRTRQDAGNNQCSSPDPSPSIRPRWRGRRRARGFDSDSSGEDSALGDEVEGGSDGEASETCENLHVQGLCDVVDIQFDNLRPSEKQLRESDFLDEEISGDEDWNGSESTT